jgi:hypothetical protein
MLFVLPRQPKVQHEWVLQESREVWTKTFKSSAAAEDDVQEDDVEMTVEGGASSAGGPADEDPFEKQMRLNYESQVRASTVQRYGKSQALGSTRGVDEKKTNSLHL